MTYEKDIISYTSKYICRKVAYWTFLISLESLRISKYVRPYNGNERIFGYCVYF